MITTLQKPDGTKTEAMIETLQLIQNQLIPEDNHKEDTTYTRLFGSKQNNEYTSRTIKKLPGKKLRRSSKVYNPRKRRVQMESQMKQLIWYLKRYK
jgi:multidrug efflux pump subunit AcrB